MGTAAICFIILFTSFIFGRIYCSMLCPLGVFQDFAGALSTSLSGKKYSFHGHFKLFRYLVFIFVVVLFALGIPSIINILDPYSIYLRGASRLLDYTIGAIMNAIAPILKSFNIYSVYLSDSIVFAPVFVLILIFFTAFFRGRLFCNTLCPVGMILGCVSQASIIRPAFNNNCISCGKCEAVCKAECINVSDKLIDSSRCVMCGNCTAACPAAAIDFFKKDHKYDHEKRETMKSIASIAVFTALPFINNKKLLMNIPALSAFSKRIKGNDVYPQIPAGAMSWARFLDKCIGCHACIKLCPSKVLESAGVRYGITGILKPVLNFNKGFCQYDCVVCGQICPFGAILPIDVDEKHRIQTGVVYYASELCVIITDGWRCGACAEHCPTGAIEMIPEENRNPILIKKELCVGCGACEYMCPVIPRKAIWVEPLAIHQAAEVLKPQDNMNIEEIHDDFVF
jgi:ferredoxin